MKARFLLLPFLAFTFLFLACNDDDDDIPLSNLKVSVSLPTVMGEEVSPEGLAVNLTNTSTGIQIDGSINANGVLDTIVEQGVYNINVSGKKTYTSTASGEQTYEQTVSLSGVLQNVSIAKIEESVDVELFISVENKGWVFKELYFKGSKTPEGKGYYKDKYFEIYNNSDKVLYADGISLCESDHKTTSELNIWADIIDKAFVTCVIYTIPGSGTDYPVQPGKSVVLADVAINHTEVNSNSFDLSNADFEWYDNHKLDVDVPEVPNLIRNFSYSKTIWTPSSQGNCSYVIFRPQGTMEEFLAENAIEKLNKNGSTVIRYKIPNSIILDAVEVSTPSGFLSKALSSALDISYTNCGDGEVSSYGKCIRRKVQSKTDGRVIYTDTNNSAVDFESLVTPKPGVIE
jgi:hypothetical protein